MEAHLLASVAFLHFLLLADTNPVLSAASGSCVFPTFSHNDKEALSWLENRLQHKSSSSRKAVPVEWAKSGRIRSVAINKSTNVWKDEAEELLNWLHNGHKHGRSHRKFFYVKTSQKIKHESEANIREYKLNAVAALDLEAQDTVLEIPMHYTISDEISKDDPSSLRGSPWELRLATKIIRERAKSVDSTWYQLIKILPKSLSLPLFFSESEINNLEDDSVISEVHLLRTFAERGFDVLYPEERAGADFNHFVWALGMVYAFSCRTEYSHHNGKLYTKSVHLLVPFLGASTDPSSVGAAVEVDGEKLKLVMGSKAIEGSPLHCHIGTRTSRDSFLFHGFVPDTIIQHDYAEVFKSVEDVVNWYLSTYGEHTQLSKDSLTKSIESRIQMLDDHPPMDPAASVPGREYSVGIDRYIGAHMICALYFLSSFDPNRHNTQDLIEDLTGMGLESTYNGFIIGNQSMLFGGLDVSACGRTPYSMDNNDIKIRKHVSMALKKRLCDILHSSPTSLEEDEMLLMASLWEGFSEERGSHLCETCQWQTEELSLNDYLGVQLRVKRKKVLHEVLLALQFDHEMVEDASIKSTKNIDILDTVRIDHNEEFLKWCRLQDARISNKLMVVQFTEASNLSNSRRAVRGIQALEDIEQGETICVLPLKMGLFKKDSSILGGADSWHLAAANLLHEKALGLESKWAQYISVLPKEIQTPIYLAANELEEIQWWPLIRELVQVRRAIKLSYTLLKGKELGNAEFEEYRWAATMVHSRAFTLPVEDDDEYAPYVLMPFMDMINHHYQYQADWMSVPIREGKLEIVAKKRVYAGQQLFASFGPRSNDNLFLYYGFVLENNPFDTAEIFASFQIAVDWFTALWQAKCDAISMAKEREECQSKEKKDKWVISQKAIEDYSAGVTEQRPEWWTLVNMWADHGYEYMQFQPSPSIYVGGIADPTLLVTLEAVAKSLLPEVIDAFGRCKGDACDSVNITKPYLDDFFTCIVETPWVGAAKWSLHSSLCAKLVSRAFSSVEDGGSYAKYMVKVGLSLRCLEILNSMPTTLEEDRLLLTPSADVSTHVQLARQYRYIKKLFLKQFIDRVTEKI